MTQLAYSFQGKLLAMRFCGVLVGMALWGDQLDAGDGLAGVANGPTQEQVVNLIETIGRDEPVPDLVDEIDSLYRPHQKILGHTFEEALRFATDPAFVSRIDVLSQELTGKPADTRTLIARANTHQRGYLMERHREEMIGDFERWAEPKKTMTGKVVDEDDRPIAGAVVSTWGGLTRTDAGGDFTLRFAHGRYGTLPPAERFVGEVAIEAEGYGTGVMSFDQNSLELGDGMIHRLYKQASCDGHVVDIQGKPIAGAEVQLWVAGRAFSRDLARGYWAGGGATVMLRSVSDAEGRYAFRGLPSRLGLSQYGLQISASHPEYQVNGDSFQNDQDPRPGINIPLEKGCTIAGTVVDETGKPVAHAWVRALFGNDDPAWFQNRLTTYTDDRGAFAFHNQVPGNVTLVVEPDDFARVVVRTVVKIDEPAKLAITTPAGAVIAGKVLDAGGRPIAGALIGDLVPIGDEGRPITDEPAPKRSARTGDDGSFRLGPLPEGWYEIAISRGGARTKISVEARDGKPDVEVRLTDVAK